MAEKTLEKNKFLSKGSYGCVFDPPLECDSIDGKTNKIPLGSVGKVFEHQQDFEEEVDAYEKVALLDPKHKWSLPLLNECVVDLDALHTGSSGNTEVRRCPFMTKNDKHLFFQIVIPYGGITLWNLFMDSKQHEVTLSQFANLLSQVLVAVNDMTKNGYAHLDIKPMNILVHEGRISLIDFSLLKKHENVYHKDNLYLLRSKYIWYPPEFYVSSRLLKDPNTNELEIARKSLYIYETPKYGLQYDAETVKKQEQALVEYIKFLKNSKDVLNQQEVMALSTKIAQKIDVYGVGVTFLNFFEAKGFKHPQLHNLLKKMTLSDPRKRISAIEAKKGIAKINL